MFKFSRSLLRKIVKINKMKFLSTNRHLFRKSNVRTLILGIESSCDDSGAAIINPHSKEILTEALIKQSSAKLGGVLPTVAMKSHAQAVPKVVDQVLDKVDISQIEAIAVTNQPGLQGSLIMGRNYAQYLCKKHQKPMIPIHHMEAHALTARLTESLPFPFLTFLISGGHCILAFAREIQEFLILGHSLDSSPGELLDKIARRLKLHSVQSEFLHVSGGQAIQEMGESGNAQTFDFTEPCLRERNCMFSFSGLKYLMLKKIHQIEGEENTAPNQLIGNIEHFCASTEFAVGKHLCRRLIRAIQFANENNLWESKPKKVVISGGVASNLRIRQMLDQTCGLFETEAVFPPVKYCSDNGVMIAWNGCEKWNLQRDIVPFQDVFQVPTIPRSPFGTNMTDLVANASIPNEKLTFLK